MKLEVIDIIEDSDGGAIVTLDMDEESKIKLIEKGFNSLLWDAIERLERESILTEKDYLKK